jgi:Fe2+ or Zn2+ uptake regulation protein
MKNKKFLIEAIEKYSFYTKAQRRLLRALVELEEDYLIKATVLELSQLSVMSRASVYRCIDTFKKEKVLEFQDSNSSSLNLFKLNKNKLEEIEKNHLKKLSLHKK